MIYISAQPDTTYFIWQLEIQLRNLNKLGIQKDNIQVLVAYNKELGLNPIFQKFIDSNSNLATYFIYEDQRKQPKYTSSIRPNILKQHFSMYPELETKTLMYHDSDILLSRIPEIDSVKENETCYVSDTRNYLDVNYIRNVSSEELLDEMLKVVSLDKDKLLKENQHTGGAQYILKGIDADFWDKVENDSERLFMAMKEYNIKLWQDSYAETKAYRSKKRGIQAWCADMWAVLWNLWLQDKKVEIHPEMAFSWPYNPIEDWDRLAIQHYSGNIEDKTKYFKKSEYLNYQPWYDDSLELIPNTNCSYKIVELIKSRKKELDQARIVLNESCIILDTMDNVIKQDQYALIKTYIQKSIDIDIYLLKNNQLELTSGIFLSENELMTIIIQDYSFALFLPITTIPDIQEIKNILLHKPIDTALEYVPQILYKVDSLFSETFSKVLDMDLLHLNQGKLNSQSISKNNVLRFVKLTSNFIESDECTSNDRLHITTTYNFIS